MKTRNALLASIADTIKDYRAGEIDEPTPDHVDRWIRQFDKDVQHPLLAELEHVLQSTYFSRQKFFEFFAKQIGSKDCVYRQAVAAFWRGANFLKLQEVGNSQHEMLEIFSEILQAELDIKRENCGSAGGPYIYLDDVIFSGNRVCKDLETWINGAAPKKATVHVIVAAIHTGGRYKVNLGLKRANSRSSKGIRIEYWPGVCLENQKRARDKSEVLWPTSQLPEDPQLKEYLKKPHKYPFVPRIPDHDRYHWPFSSEEGRQLLEREMLLAGVRILGLSNNPEKILRPLGFSPFGLGFGSTIVTYRNCANNCPLAMWWGEPDATSGPFHWYPLFPRKTNEKKVNDREAEYEL